MGGCHKKKQSISKHRPNLDLTAGASHRSFPLGPDAVPVAVHCSPSRHGLVQLRKTWHPRHLMTAATMALF